MSILDGILGQVSQNVDVANLASKVGLSPEHVEQAVQALAKFHPMDTDTAEGAASETCRWRSSRRSSAISVARVRSAASRS